MPIITVKNVKFNSVGEIMTMRKFTPFFIFTKWRPWRLRNNLEYKIELEMMKKVQELIKLRDELLMAKEVIKKEAADIKVQSYRYEESRPFQIKVSYKEKSTKRFKDLDKPAPDWWKGILTHEFMKREGGGFVTAGMANKIERNRKKGVSVVTANEAAASSFSLDSEALNKADDIYPHKERNQQNQQGKGKKAYMKRRDTETPQEHQERIKRIQTGQANPDDFLTDE